MGKIRHIIFCGVILAALLGGCTKNDGDIGPLFGNWKVMSVSYQNMTGPEIPEGTDQFWQFQAEMLRVSDTSLYSDVTVAFGQFTLSDNTLHLDFSDTSYTPPLGLPRDCELQVIELSGSTLQVMYHPTLDSAQTITLKKW